MEDLIFATNNSHKLAEIRTLISDRFRILSLRDEGIETQIPEDYETLPENALQKAGFIHNLTGKNCFADDTGLEVDALDGEPGVYSARYSRMGDLQFPDMDVTQGNIHKLLLKMRDVKDRTARFRTVIALVMNRREFLFEGIVEGEILRDPSGNQGFGYDPVFRPRGFTQSFAEMEMIRKNRISHRARAMSKLVEFLNNPEY